MKSRIISVDLAKDVFELATANAPYPRTTSALTRQVLTAAHRAPARPGPAGSLWHRPLLGATGDAAGHEARIIPAQYVKPYRQRNKTDRVDIANYARFGPLEPLSCS